MNSAFSWNTDNATLEMFTCTCGVDVISGPREYKKLENNDKVECPRCEQEFKVQMNVRLVELSDDNVVQEQKTESSSDDGPEEYANKIRERVNQIDTDRVRLKYKSSISKNVKSVVADEKEIRQSIAKYVVNEPKDDGVDEGDEFIVYFGDTSTRDKSTVTRNGRKIGEFVTVEET